MNPLAHTHDGRRPGGLFWLLQVGGWSGYCVMNFLQGLVHGKEPVYILPSIVYAIAGFMLTLLLRELYYRLWQRPPWILLPVATVASLLVGMMFEATRVLAYINLYPTDWYLDTWWHAFEDFTLSWYLMMAWSGLYFGIKYYRTVQDQREMLLRANSMAHEAQLKMLRYQLNPHFLFNTLNAISTLILAGENHTANQMVTRLSSFLRHSLDRDPMQKLPLKKELEALKLYLSIEQIRFEDRLRLRWDIDEPAWQARVPSMILQPVIENAIKHAIAPRDDEGVIAIAATVSAGELCLSVTDNGPGVDDPDSLLSTPQGRGVGLANTRERLAVLYGERQRFEVRNVEPTGLRVTLCFPCERGGGT